MLKISKKAYSSMYGLITIDKIGSSLCSCACNCSCHCNCRCFMPDDGCFDW